MDQKGCSPGACLKECIPPDSLCAAAVLAGDRLARWVLDMDSERRLFSRGNISAAIVDDERLWRWPCTSSGCAAHGSLRALPAHVAAQRGGCCQMDQTSAAQTRLRSVLASVRRRAAAAAAGAASGMSWSTVRTICSRCAGAPPKDEYICLRRARASRHRRDLIIATRLL